MLEMTNRPSSDLIWQDTQHNMLFEILDDLAEQQASIRLIQRLKLYADHHFCLEEAYMEKLDFPDRERHITAHNKFRQELTQLEDEFARNDMALAFRKAVSDFLSEWLVRHIEGVDKDFEHFVLASQHK